MSLKHAAEEVIPVVHTNDDVSLDWLFKFNGKWKLRERTNFEQVIIIIIIICLEFTIPSSNVRPL